MTLAMLLLLSQMIKVNELDFRTLVAHCLLSSVKLVCGYLPHSLSLYNIPEGFKQGFHT